VVWVVSGTTGPPNFLPVGEATGRIIRSIVAGPHIGTGLPRTDLGVVRAVIRFPNASPVLGSKLQDRAEIWPVSRRPAGAWVTGQPAQAEAVAREEAGSATELADQIPSGAGTCRVVAQETGMLSEAAPKDSMDPARAVTVAVAPPAWDLEAEEASVVEAGAAPGVAAVAADKRSDY
jgi:hypothetical protein